MTRARELAEAGAPPGTVVVADYQSDGRGTHGRSWLAPPGSCLMFTLIARPSIPVETLTEIPLRVSNSIAALLRDEFGLTCEVKPPNDILVAGKKLCGVLCASHLVGDRVEWLLVGIGLNTTMTDANRPLKMATSLSLESVATTEHVDLLQRLLTSVGWLVVAE